MPSSACSDELRLESNPEHAQIQRTPRLRHLYNTLDPAAGQLIFCGMASKLLAVRLSDNLHAKLAKTAKARSTRAKKVTKSEVVRTAIVKETSLP